MAKNVVILVRQEGLGSAGTAEKEFGLDMFDRFLLRFAKILADRFCSFRLALTTAIHRLFLWRYRKLS